MNLEIATNRPHEPKLEERETATGTQYRYVCACGTTGRWERGKGSVGHNHAAHINRS